MKTECPYCRKRFKVPNAYSGRPAKCCFCKQAFVVAPYKPPPIVETEAVKEAAQQLAKSGNNLFVSAWKRTPLPFKTAFFATLGVIAALAVAVKVYRFQIPRTAKDSDLSVYREQLESRKHFSDGRIPQKGIFRGRSLTRYGYVPDANKAIPYIELWVDDQDVVVVFVSSW